MTSRSWRKSGGNEIRKLPKLKKANDQGASRGWQKAGRLIPAWGVLRESEESFREEEANTKLIVITK